MLVMTTTTMTHLDSIVRRERKTLVRDVAFAVAVALAALIGVTSVMTAADVAGTAVPLNVAQR